MSAIQNHKALWRKKRQCCDAKDVKRKPKTASHVKIVSHVSHVKKNEKGIEITIYRKNTHTGLYNKWESLSPIQYNKVLATSFPICCTVLYEYWESLSPIQYNKVPYKAFYIVPTKFAAHTNWSTKNFNILNPVFLAMDTGLVYR